MNNLIQRIIAACCAAVIICGVHSARADSWNSVILDENIPIDKIVPGRDGVYFVSDGTLRYWDFQDQAYTVVPIIPNPWGYYIPVLDCELTREGYLAVGFRAGEITIFSGTEKMTGFGTGAVIEHDLDYMDVLVTGPDSLVFTYYEGAFRVTGDKYNNQEPFQWNIDGDWFWCEGHNNTIWAAIRLSTDIQSFFIRRIDQETASMSVDLEGVFRGFCCDSADTLWIGTSRGLYWVPSDVEIGLQPGPVLCPTYPGQPPTSVVCDATGRTLVGSSDGLYLYDRITWTHITPAEGLAGSDIRCVGVDPDNRFYAAGEGWFSHEKEIHVGVGVDRQAAPLTMHSPYPNPANASVVIGYTLDHDAPVRIALYNALGQKVLNVHDGRMMAGLHQATFTTNDLASGLYFIRIEAGVYHSFAKVTVMK